MAASNGAREGKNKPAKSRRAGWHESAAVDATPFHFALFKIAVDCQLRLSLHTEVEATP